ncbi:MAG: CsgE family curli-type amyloid fiber assembly protein, partial [Bacteroidota bacterium]
MANQFASKILILFILVFLSNSVLSQKIIKPPEKEPEKESRSDGVEFMSFVFNETITKIGADFYRMFNNDWENPTDVEGVSLHIKEKPRPGMGALLMI